VFEFACATRIVAGASAVDRAGALASELGRRAIVIADAELFASGRITALAAALQQAGVGLLGSIEVGPASKASKAETAAAVDGQGGRPAPDVIVVAGSDRAFDQLASVTSPLPIIGVPTSASSGRGQGRCRLVILDPELSVDVPDAQLASSAITAISRAIESWVTSRRSPMSDLFARESWRLMSASYLRALGGSGDLDALSDVLLGCMLAEVASSQSGLGALEACARPITSSVGQAAALAILLPEVVRWNMRVVADRYAELAAVRGEARRPETLVARLEDFVLAGGFPGRLGAAGIVERDLPALAELAAAEPAALTNPRKFDVAGALELYAATY
jgi:alcohol dehydrogenase class IV